MALIELRNNTILRSSSAGRERIANLPVHYWDTRNVLARTWETMDDINNYWLRKPIYSSRYPNESSYLADGGDLYSPVMPSFERSRYTTPFAYSSPALSYGVRTFLSEPYSYHGPVYGSRVTSSFNGDAPLTSDYLTAEIPFLGMYRPRVAKYERHPSAYYGLPKFYW